LDEYFTVNGSLLSFGQREEFPAQEQAGFAAAG
jgi:hypothetical protein